MAHSSVATLSSVWTFKLIDVWFHNTRVRQSDMAMIIAQVWCRCLCMLVHGLRLQLCILIFSAVHDLRHKNEVYLHCWMKPPQSTICWLVVVLLFWENGAFVDNFSEILTRPENSLQMDVDISWSPRLWKSRQCRKDAKQTVLTHLPCNVFANILSTYGVPRAQFVSLHFNSLGCQFVGVSVIGAVLVTSGPPCCSNNVSWTKFGVKRRCLRGWGWTIRCFEECEGRWVRDEKSRVFSKNRTPLL